MNDWKINLIIPDELNEEEVGKFNSDLGKTLCYIKNMGRPDVVKKMSSDERFRSMSPDAVLVLNEIMGADFKISEREEPTEMSYAIEKIREEGAVKGAIEAYRAMQLSEDSVLEMIIKQFNLTEEDAQNNMLQESA